MLDQIILLLKKEKGEHEICFYIELIFCFVKKKLN